jgi:hypothetical protein
VLRSLAVAVALVASVGVYARDSFAEKGAPIIRDIRGTESTPLVVKGIPAEKSKLEEERETEKFVIDRDMRDLTRELRDVGNRTVLLTIALAFIASVQAVLFVWQLRLMRESTKVAADSAKAALAQAEAVKLSERAYVFVEIVITYGHAAPGVVNPIQMKVQACNYGKTPAIVTKIRAYADVRAGTDVPQTLVQHDAAEQRLPPGLGIAAGGHYDVDVAKTLPSYEAESVNGGSRTLYCVGAVEYHDIMHTVHETSFCWQYVPRSAAFLISRDSGLNRQS